MPQLINQYQDEYAKYYKWYHQRKPNQAQVNTIQNHLELVKNILKDQTTNNHEYTNTLNQVANLHYILNKFQLKLSYYQFVEYTIDLGHEIGHPFNTDIQNLINQLVNIIETIPLQNQITNRLIQRVQNINILQGLINFVFLIDSNHIEKSYTNLQSYSINQIDKKYQKAKHDLKQAAVNQSPQKLMYSHQANGYQVLKLIRKQFERLKNQLDTQYKIDIKALHGQLVLNPSLKIKNK